MEVILLEIWSKAISHFKKKTKKKKKKLKEKKMKNLFIYSVWEMKKWLVFLRNTLFNQIAVPLSWVLFLAFVVIAATAIVYAAIDVAAETATVLDIAASGSILVSCKYSRNYM